MYKNIATMDFSIDPEEYTPPASHVDLRAMKREGIDLYIVKVPKDLDVERLARANQLIRDLEFQGENVEVVEV